MKYEECCYNCKNVGSKECVSEIYGYDIKSQHCEGYVLRDELAKIENGTLVELPCKVGDTICYFNRNGNSEEIRILSSTVKSLTITKSGNIRISFKDTFHSITTAEYDIMTEQNLLNDKFIITGEFYKCSIEQAEARLKEMQEKKK